MFSDPQSVTINAVAQSLARIQMTGKSATYQKSDGVWKLIISHQEVGAKRIRTMVRLEQRAIVTNPLDSTNDYDTLVDYHVIDRPVYGFTLTQVQQQVAGLNAWLDNTAVGKLFGLES